VDISLSGEHRVVVVNNGEPDATRRWATEAEARFPVLAQEKLSVSGDIRRGAIKGWSFGFSPYSARPQEFYVIAITFTIGLARRARESPRV
jgi:hypothetical protein